MRRAGPAAALVVAVVVLVAGGCTPAAERPPPKDPQRPIITVTSFDFPESEALAELYGEGLRQHGYPVEPWAAGPRNSQQPSSRAASDLAGYLGTALNSVRKARRHRRPKATTPAPSAHLPGHQRLPCKAEAARFVVQMTWPPAQVEASATSPDRTHSLRGPTNADRPLCLKG